MQTILAFARTRATDLDLARDAMADLVGFAAVAILFLAAFAVPSLI